MLNRHTLLVAVGTVLLCTTMTRNAAAGPFQAGDLLTFTQDDWGDGSASATTDAPGFLSSYFNALYGALGYVEVGVLGTPGEYAMLFTSASALFSYLPGSGTAAALSATLVDPTSSGSGIFGGEVVALRLNVDFSDAGYLPGALGVLFGDLVIHDYAPFPDANGLSVRQFLGQVNLALAGGIPSYGYAPATRLAQELNGSFSPVPVQNADGSFQTEQRVSQFAQDHLAVGASAIPEPGTLTLLGIALVSLTARRSRLHGSSLTLRRFRSGA